MDNFTSEQKQALKYDSHSIVTANAGSGKTKVFSFRFVNIALGVALNDNNQFIQITDNPPDVQKLVAITYTDKAASELYTKIVAEIDSRIQDEKNEQILKKLYRLRRDIISANISTIHSFCMRLLKKFPIKAKLDPNFIPVDTRISEELVDESVIELFNDCLSGEFSEDLKYLVRVFGGKDLFTKALQNSINKRVDILDLNELYLKSEKEIADFFSDMYCKIRSTIIPAEKIKRFYDLMAEINETALDVTKKGSAGNNNAIMVGELLDNYHSYDFDSLSGFIQACRDNNIITSKFDLNCNSYFNKKVRETCNHYRGEISEFLSSVSNFLFNSFEEKKESELQLALFGIKFIKVFNALNCIYQRKKDENGFLDFEDLLLKARDLIKDDSVCDDLKKEIDYIMIDEYQDTNQLQYDLFLPILSNLNEKLQRGNLFVVGDEKQSIYMFRNADLKIFNNTYNDITGNNGSKINLPHSFRMAYHNCLFTNILFRNLFYSDITEDISLFNEVKNTPLICGLGKGTNGFVELGFIENAKAVDESEEDQIQKEESDSQELYSEEDLVAARIIEFVKNPKFLIKEKTPEFRHAAVLCRKKDSFPFLEKAFVKYGIPYLIVGGQGFYSSQIVKDFYNYLSFLLNQNDDTSLAGIIRSPFFSLSDSALFEISLQKDNGLWSKIKRYNGSGGLEAELKKITEVLNENIEYARCYPPAYVIRKILSESPYAGVISAKENGIQDNANIEKLISIAHDFDSGGLSSLYDFVDFLKDSIENNPDENQAAVVSDQNCVKIMTVHQSKGLEFPAVFLFQCHKVTMKNSTKSKDVNISRDYGILTKVPGTSLFKEYIVPPICAAYDYIQEKREEAELKRLLYVAVTRAANFLFISASYKISAKGKISFPKTSFMGLIEKGLLPDDCFESYLLEKSKEINIRGDISYKVSKENEDLLKDEDVTLTIPILNQIDCEPVVKQDSKVDCEILLNEIQDYSPSDEIITASKYADYINNPGDYYVRYVLGLEINKYHAGNNKKNLGALKGSVIHYFLGTSVPASKEKIIEIINDIAGPGTIADINEFAETIRSEIELYYDSPSFEFVKNYNNFINEYELWYYNKEGLFYMHGIIDKVIFCNDEAIILDYKTNSIKENEIESTANSYKPQLEFYALLLSKLNSTISNIRLKIVFTRYPGAISEWVVNKGDLSEIEEKVLGTLAGIRSLMSK